MVVLTLMLAMMVFLIMLAALMVFGAATLVPFVVVLVTLSAQSRCFGVSRAGLHIMMVVMVEVMVHFDRFRPAAITVAVILMPMLAFAAMLRCQQGAAKTAAAAFSACFSA